MCWENECGVCIISNITEYLLFFLLWLMSLIFLWVRETLEIENAYLFSQLFVLEYGYYWFSDYLNLFWKSNQRTKYLLHYLLRYVSKFAPKLYTVRNYIPFKTRSLSSTLIFSVMYEILNKKKILFSKRLNLTYPN